MEIIIVLILLPFFIASLDNSEEDHFGINE